MSIRALFSSPRTTRQSSQNSAEPETSLWRRAVALGLAVLLLPFVQLDLFAQAPGQAYPPQQSTYPQQSQQETPPPPPDYPQGQPGYPQTQPNYQQPQEETPPPPPDQQPYAQPYPNQAPQAQPPYPNSGQPYGQQPYSQQPYDSQQPYAQQPGYPDQAYDQAPQYPQPPAQPQAALGPDQLDQLVAPIALDPDTLIAQILAASTYPTQIAEADRWRQSMGYAAPQDIAAGANAQPWDPSVKALTAFPQVLDELNENLSWATELGNAYFNQPQDVFDAIQAMRQRAQAAGTLQTGPQETVTNDQGYIDIAPANPQIVYVPTYDPWVVYGAPVNPWPGFLLGALGTVVGGFGLRFGPGLVMSAFTGMPWGWFGWGLSWLGHCLFFGNAGYYPHGPGLRDWGLRYGGPRAPWGRNFAYARAYDRGFDRGFNRGYDRAGAYGRGSFDGRSGAYGNRGSFGNQRAFENRGYENRGFNQNPGYANRGYADPRSGFANRPGYGNTYGRPNQQAYNREPAFNARPGAENYGRTPQSFQSYRGSESFRSPMQSYARPSAPSSVNRGFGNSFRQPQSSFRSSTPAYRAYGGSSGFDRGFSGSRSFSGARSGGFFGGSHSESMPHSSSHSFGGGGSHFSGGGHSFGGGHSGGGGHSSSHGGGGHHR